MYTDSQIIKYRRKYPLQITKMLPDIDLHLDYLESELDRLETKGIRAAVFTVKNPDWNCPKIVLMRMVYKDDMYIEKHFTLEYHKLKKVVDKRGKSILADQDCWRYRKKCLRAV